MPEETYKGKTIQTINDELKIIIDGEEILVDFDDDEKTYNLYTVLPYETFPTLLDLAKAIIDKTNGGA